MARKTFSAYRWLNLSFSRVFVEQPRMSWDACVRRRIRLARLLVPRRKLIRRPTSRRSKLNRRPLMSRSRSKKWNIRSSKLRLMPCLERSEISFIARYLFRKMRTIISLYEHGVKKAKSWPMAPNLASCAIMRSCSVLASSRWREARVLLDIVAIILRALASCSTKR